MVSNVAVRARVTNVVQTYRVFLVKPLRGFSPRNWQQKPKEFQIIKRLEFTNRIGRADSLRWLTNQAALESGLLNEWAVVLPPQKSRSERYCPTCSAA